MDSLPDSIRNYIMSSYILVGVTLIGSYLYVLISKKHTITFTLTMIYLLEILSQSCYVATFKLTSGTRLYDSIYAVAFSAHWLAVGFFTREYVLVAY